MSNANAKVTHLEEANRRARMLADASTLALIPKQYRVKPTVEEPSAYSIAVGASIAALLAAAMPSGGVHSCHDNCPRLMCVVHRVLRVAVLPYKTEEGVEMYPVPAILIEKLRAAVKEE